MTNSASQIEVRAELKMDALDRNFLRGDLTQEEYDEAVKALDAWTQGEYLKIAA